jgi:hypothetical protein
MWIVKIMDKKKGCGQVLRNDLNEINGYLINKQRESVAMKKASADAFILQINQCAD